MTTQTMYKLLSTVVIVVAVFVASYAFATLSNGPSQNPPAGNRAPFLNTGPIEQNKLGRLDIGTTNSSDVAFSVDSGVANLIGGINVTNMTGGSTVAATIDAPMYVGYNQAGSRATPATLIVNNQLAVAGTLRDDSLSHNGTSPAPVCVNTDGVLVSCSTSTTMSCVPITEKPSPCQFTDDPGPSYPDVAQCASVNNSAGFRVNHYQIINQTGLNWSYTQGPSVSTNPSGGFLTPYQYSQQGELNHLQPFRMRAVDGACVGPWSDEFPTVVINN